MPRPVRRVDIYLPVNFNDRRTIPESMFSRLENELLTKFGGVTSVQSDFPLRGLWRGRSVAYEDHVVVLTAMDFDVDDAPVFYDYLHRLKSRLKRRFRQLDVLITVQDLVAV